MSLAWKSKRVIYGEIGDNENELSHVLRWDGCRTDWFLWLRLEKWIITQKP